MTPDSAPVTSSRWQPFRKLDSLNRSPACYVELGDPTAPPLVFLHGFGGDQLTWHYCVVSFASRFRVISVDLPGHGRSTLDVGAGTLAEMRDWLAEFLTKMGIARARIVGHSMGGKIAISLALDRPDLVESLSLISPAGLGGYFDLDLLHRFRDVDAPGVADEIAARLVGAGGSAVIPGLTKALRTGGARPGQAMALARLLDNAGTINVALSETGVPWARIACPVQVIWGAEDTVLPLPEKARLPPGVPVDLLPGIGHLPQIEAPKQVAALLAGFLS